MNRLGMLVSRTGIEPRQRHCIADLDDYSCAVVKWLANGGEVMVATTPFIDGDLVAIGDED
jgi:hypothetical protein